MTEKKKDKRKPETPWKEESGWKGSWKVVCSASVKLLLATVCPLHSSSSPHEPREYVQVCVRKRRQDKKGGNEKKGGDKDDLSWQSAEWQGEPSWGLGGPMYIYVMPAAIRNKLLEGPGN